MDKSDTPHGTDCPIVDAFQAKIAARTGDGDAEDWPSFARRLERELAASIKDADNAIEIARAVDAKEREELRGKLAAALSTIRDLEAALEAVEARVNEWPRYEVAQEALKQLWKSRAEQAEAKLAELRKRLEIDTATDGNGNLVPFPEGAPDGISCRDETIRMLEEKLEEAQKDAERYRWLKNDCRYGFDGSRNQQLVHATENGPHENPTWRADLDVAIDKAMKAGRG